MFLLYELLDLLMPSNQKDLFDIKLFIIDLFSCHILMEYPFVLEELA